MPRLRPLEFLFFFFLTLDRLKRVYWKMRRSWQREGEIRNGREKECLMETDPEGGRRD